MCTLSVVGLAMKPLLLLLMELNTKKMVQVFCNCVVVRTERLLLLELPAGELFSLP